jgi:hypothetical protein
MLAFERVGMTAPSFFWLIAIIMRRMRTRLPTCLSTGLGDFFLFS